MANFTTLGFIDPYDLLCSMKGRLGAFQGTGLRVLYLRAARKSSPDEFLDTRELARWPEARAIIARIGEAYQNRLGQPAVFGRAYCDMLDAGIGTRPRRDLSMYAARHVRIVYGLRCNPGAVLWCPPEQYTIASGEVVLTGAALWHGALNMGEHARVNLVIDVELSEKITPLPEPADFESLPEEEEVET